MLEVKMLGQFEIRRDGTPIVISSRPAQSLLAFLLLNVDIAHRREKIAGILWPNISDENARNNLRHQLWRLRQALANDSYLQVDDVSITFNHHSEYWCDAHLLARANGAASSANELIAALDLYRGDLLPGFYDDWIVLERERMRAIFDQLMAQLLERLQAEQRWSDILEWSERWIALGQSPEPAFRALMIAHSELGDMSKLATTFQRCIEALHNDLNVEPSEQTRTLFAQLKNKKSPIPQLSNSLLPSDEPPAGEPPFKGLQYFDEKDAAWYFGRGELIAKLVNQLRATGLLMVIGASGSGKSSLVRAGLVPALKREGSWQSHVITPTAHPLEALAISLTREVESSTLTTELVDDLAHDARALRVYCQKKLSAGHHTLIVIDQFEELFTLCRDEAERKLFIGNLLASTMPTNDKSIFLILALRADFYAHCAHYANLRDALEKYQAYIGQMGAAELRCAIEEPARRGDWSLEPGLVDLFLRDAGAGDEPGALPLLSHALLETWLRRRGRQLTFAGYAASGGVRGAIAKTAENVYQQMDPAEQGIARNIFLRLTELGEGTQDTCRRVNFNELVPPSNDSPSLVTVLNTLAAARLITLGENSVEVAHEALIREWLRLREWLNQDRAGLQLHRHLTEAAQEWERLGLDPGSLYRGTRLGQALEWAESKPVEMNRQEWLFLDASKEQAEQEEAEREAQRQRELRAAQKLAEEKTRAAAKLRQRAVFLTGTLLIALVLAVAASWFAQQSNQNEQVAIAQKGVAEDERRIAFVRELSVNAVSNLEIDPERSILLALQAVSASTAGGKPVLREAEEALHRAVMTSRVQLTLRGHANQVLTVAFSPDGRRVATASADNTAKIWDAVTGKELLTLSGHANQVWAATFSPDGTRVATASYDKTAKVWDAATGKELLTLSGHTDQVWAVTFSPDGRRIATSSADKTARVWDADSGKELLTFSGHTDIARRVVFSPDGTRLYTGSYDKTAKIWDAATGKALLTLTGHTGAIWGIAISPDGTRLATTGIDGTAKIWDTASGRQLSNLTLDSSGDAIAFNQAGTRLATCTGDGTATVWDIATGQILTVLSGHTGALGGCVFSPDSQGTRLATSAADSTARVWDISPGGGRDWFTFAGHSDRVFDIAYSPDGKYLASASADKTAKIWDAATGMELLTLAGHTNWVQAVAFSPDGKRLATTSDDLTAKVWDLSTGKVQLTLPAGPAMQGLGCHCVAFSPDGKRLVITSDDNTAKVWDATSGQELLTLTGHTGIIQTVAFSNDGRRIATASRDKTAKLWDAVTGKELVTLLHTSQVWHVAFSSDGARVVTGSSDGTAKVWDAATGKLLLTLSHGGVVIVATFSPDGTHLATGGGSKTAKIWNVAQSGGQSEQPLTLYGHTASVYGVAFSPDGKRLATASLDGIAHVYALPLDEIVTIAKSRVTRTLTNDECQKFLHLDKCP